MPGLSRMLFILPDTLVLRDPTFPAKKQSKHIRKGLDRGTLKTCPDFQGLLHLSESAWIFFLYGNVKNQGFASCFLGFSGIRCWVLIMSYYQSYAVSSSHVCTINKPFTHILRGTWKRLVQDNVLFGFYPTINA